MREEVLRRYLQSEIPVNSLVDDLQGTVTQLNEIISKIAIHDMEGSFVVTRQHVIILCDAALAHDLKPDALTTIAFALISSDHFEWDGEDEIIAEVLGDWSAPEVNLPMNVTTLQMHRNWLSGHSESPIRRTVSRPGRLLSLRLKVPLIDGTDNG